MNLRQIRRGIALACDRTATATIKGYFYQFDLFILNLLELSNDSDTVCIEGIEDVDIRTAGETTAIQCKYYEGTEYNHSVISKPIRFMLKHFVENHKKRKQMIKYTIYGYYSSGQKKLPANFDINFLKEKFLTYSGKKYFEELNLSDNKLTVFLQNLTININAPKYENQEKQIYNKLKNIFSCSDYEADYYYNNALSEVKRLSTIKNESERTITKRNFISNIERKNTRDALFDTWFIEKKGVSEYCKSIKSQFFTIYNIPSYERIFLLECDDLISVVDLKTLLQNISKKWSKLSLRSKDPFCPYVYLHNISNEKLVEIKKMLQNDDFYFIDGYDFKGADFLVNSIIKKATAQNKIKLKIINEIEQIDNILTYLSTTREIYQFFKNKEFYENTKHKHIKIAIKETKNINGII